MVWRSVLLCDGDHCCCGVDININVELCCLLGISVDVGWRSVLMWVEISVDVEWRSVLMWGGDQC